MGIFNIINKYNLSGVGIVKIESFYDESGKDLQELLDDLILIYYHDLVDLYG
jgi:hypothetical protein